MTSDCLSPRPASERFPVNFPLTVRVCLLHSVVSPSLTRHGGGSRSGSANGNGCDGRGHKQDKHVAWFFQVGRRGPIGRECQSALLPTPCRGSRTLRHHLGMNEATSFTGTSRHSLSQTGGATAALSIDEHGAPSTTRNWIKTRCVDNADCIKACATGFNREPVSTAVSSLVMGQGCFEAEFRIDVLEGCLSLGVVKLACDNRERVGLAMPIAGDARKDSKCWDSSPCSKWNNADKISKAFYITEKGVLMNGSSRVVTKIIHYS